MEKTTRWRVEVDGYMPVVIEAATKGKAKYAAYKMYAEANGRLPFLDFVVKVWVYKY